MQTHPASLALAVHGVMEAVEVELNNKI